MTGGRTSWAISLAYVKKGVKVKISGVVNEKNKQMFISNQFHLLRSYTRKEVVIYQCIIAFTQLLCFNFRRE